MRDPSLIVSLVPGETPVSHEEDDQREPVLVQTSLPRSRLHRSTSRTVASDDVLRKC